jgi:probable F420-dependent oxidoreductase
MQIGVVFPQTEFGSDPAAVRDFAQTAEGLGYAHVVAYEHVLGADPAQRGTWGRRYTHKDAFLEPFVLFSTMAAVTTRLGFCTGVLVLPQRQTALVAKQAATLDVLSGGRLRLGVGIGWNPVEYEALGQDFHTRGRRIEEQVRLLRKLWTEPLVDFEGTWDQVKAAGLNPLPVQRPIPIWMGGHAEPVLRRTARMADGWLPGWRTADEARAELERLWSHLEAAGRDRASFGLEARMAYGNGDAGRWRQVLEGWRDAGATHVSVNTMGGGLDTEGHLGAMRRFGDAIVGNW